MHIACSLGIWATPYAITTQKCTNQNHPTRQFAWESYYKLIIIPFWLLANQHNKYNKINSLHAITSNHWAISWHYKQLTHPKSTQELSNGGNISKQFSKLCSIVLAMNLTIDESVNFVLLIRREKYKTSVIKYWVKALAVEMNQF